MLVKRCEQYQHFSVCRTQREININIHPSAGWRRSDKLDNIEQKTRSRRCEEFCFGARRLVGKQPGSFIPCLCLLPCSREDTRSSWEWAGWCSCQWLWRQGSTSARCGRTTSACGRLQEILYSQHPSCAKKRNGCWRNGRCSSGESARWKLIVKLSRRAGEVRVLGQEERHDFQHGRRRLRKLDFGSCFGPHCALAGRTGIAWQAAIWRTPRRTFFQ